MDETLLFTGVPFELFVGDFPPACLPAGLGEGDDSESGVSGSKNALESRAASVGRRGTGDGDVCSPGAFAFSARFLTAAVTAKWSMNSAEKIEI